MSLIAIAATLALLGWQRHVIRRTASLAIATDHLHYQSDLALNFAVIGALALDQYAHVEHADGVFGFVIACWLGLGAWRASHKAINQLMDHEWPEEKKQRFIEVLARHPDLRGAHDLRTRTAGNLDFVQFHVTVDPKMTVRDAHRVMDAIEAQLVSEFPGHRDPDPSGSRGVGRRGRASPRGPACSARGTVAGRRRMSNPVRYWHVDAFADRPFAGNQAAVMPLDAWPEDAILQAIAEENKFAETAFLVPDASGAATRELRWFTPETEVRLCGHATLAAGHVLLTLEPEREP